MEHTEIGSRLIEKFMPHGACFFWQFDILLPFVLGEVLTAISYMFIPICLFVLLRSKLLSNQALKPIFVIYAAFILFCGVGHILNIFNVWYGFYRISAYLSVTTGAVSLLAAMSTLYLCKLYLKHVGKHKHILESDDGNNKGT